MHLKQIRFGLTMLELAESVEPDLEKIITAAAQSGGKPTVRECWPAIRDVLDQAVKGPVGDIRL